MKYSNVILIGGEHNGIYVNVPVDLHSLGMYVVKGFGIIDFPAYRIEIYQRADETMFIIA